MEWLSTCELADTFGDAARVLQGFRSFGAHGRFSGRVRTVKCYEDNSRIKEVLATPGEGCVLVVDGGGSRRCALLGDLIATTAVENGWSGVIVYGCVRDSAVLSELDLGIAALGTTPRRSVRRGEGVRDLDLTIDGVSVRPDDQLFADADGIVLLAADATLPED